MRITLKKKFMQEKKFLCLVQIAEIYAYCKRNLAELTQQPARTRERDLKSARKEKE